MIIKSKPASKEYQEGYDRIFGKCKTCGGTGTVTSPQFNDEVVDCPTCTEVVIGTRGGKYD